MRVVGYMRRTSCLVGEDAMENVMEIQRLHMEEYACRYGYGIERIYSDDTLDAEMDDAFQMLLRDGMKREFDLVITDSVLRCGCSLWKAREVLMQTLFPAGIHFAVVEDDFCSIGKSMEEVEEFFRQKYGKYKEENIKRKVMKRSQKGLLSWSDAKYGYNLDENNRLAVNEKTAPVVKRIFEMYVDGMNLNAIAKMLKEEKIPTPRAMRRGVSGTAEPYNWLRGSVKDILGRSVYCGRWTKKLQGKEMTFTNEAIISSELYEAAQNLLKNQAGTPRPQKNRHKYQKILMDKEFGSVFRFRTNKENYSYCAYLTAELSARCEKKQLPESEIDQAVRWTLRREHKRAREIRDWMEYEGEHYRERQLVKIKSLLRIQGELLAESEKKKMTAYRQMQDGILTKYEFEDICTENKKIRESVEGQFRRGMHQAEQKKIALSMDNPWMKLFLDWEETEEITRENLMKYVERIEVSQLSIDRVILKENEWYKELPEEWRQLQENE